MAVDLGVFERQKSIVDQQQLQDAFELKKALAGAELQKALKPEAFDISKVGQMAFIKARQGLPLNPTEQASLEYLDNKEQTSVYDPLSGNLVQKPSLLQRAGIGFGNTQPSQSAPAASPSNNFTKAMQPNVPSTGGGGDFLADVAPSDNAAVAEFVAKNPLPPVIKSDPRESEIAAEANRQRAAAGNNRRMLMDIDKSENDARLKLISQKGEKAQVGAEKYSKQLEATGLSELVGAAERANNAIAGLKDIPGYGAAGASQLPDFLTSQAGVNVRQEISGLKNAILKARSGGAVTPSEADRMMGELGSGLGRSDANLRQGILNVTRTLNDKLLNVGAGYNKEAKDFYVEQGGTVTPDRLQKFLQPENLNTTQPNTGGWSIREVK